MGYSYLKTEEALRLILAIEALVQPVAEGNPDDAANICCEVHRLLEAASEASKRNFEEVFKRGPA